MAGTGKAPGNMPAQGEQTGTGSQGTTGLVHKAQQVAGSVASTARDMASRAAEKADDALATVGSGMSSLAGTIRDKGPHTGMLGTAASSVAGGLQAGGDYLQEHGMGDMMSDLTKVIRQYPIPSLLVGFGVGFLLARVTSRG
jgi:hypothetical protein